MPAILRNDKTIGGDGYDYCVFHENDNDECEYTDLEGAVVIEKKTITPASEDYGHGGCLRLKSHKNGTLAKEFLTTMSGDRLMPTLHSHHSSSWTGETYTVEESPLSGWRIADIQCVNTDPRIINPAWTWYPEGGVEVKM
jgi:hypothetical protein